MVLQVGPKILSAGPAEEKFEAIRDVSLREVPKRITHLFLASLAADASQDGHEQHPQG